MTTKNDEIYYEKVSESIRQVFDVTSRNDERIKQLIRNYEKLEERANFIDKNIVEINLKLQKLDTGANSNEKRWKTIFSFIFQAVLGLFVAYLVFKMNWK